MGNLPQTMLRLLLRLASRVGGNSELFEKLYLALHIIQL
jgi:hypothetical protein